MTAILSQKGRWLIALEAIRASTGTKHPGTHGSNSQADAPKPSAKASYPLHNLAEFADDLRVDSMILA